MFDILQLILSSGRTGLLYKDLVQEKKLAVNAAVVSTYPAGRYTNQFVFFVLPAAGHTVDENEKALDALLLKFVSAPVDLDTLKRAQTKARAAVIRRLGDNAGLASLLTAYAGSFGDWRNMFTSLEDYDKVTVADVQRVALKYLTARPRTVAYIRTRPQIAPGPGGRQ